MPVCRKLQCIEETRAWPSRSAERLGDRDWPPRELERSPRVPGDRVMSHDPRVNASKGGVVRSVLRIVARTGRIVPGDIAGAKVGAVRLSKRRGGEDACKRRRNDQDFHSSLQSSWHLLWMPSVLEIRAPQRCASKLTFTKLNCDLILS